MKYGLALLFILLITGCGFTGKLFNKSINGLPSVQNCEEVTYQRKNSEVDVTAKCRLPPTDSGELGISGLLK